MHILQSNCKRIMNTSFLSSATVFLVPTIPNKSLLMPDNIGKMHDYDGQFGVKLVIDSVQNSAILNK